MGEEVEVACRVREGVVGVHHPSLVGVVEVVGEPFLDHRALVAAAVVVVVPFQVREAVAVVHHQTLVGVVEVVAAAQAATFQAREEVGAEEEVEEQHPAASERTP